MPMPPSKHGGSDLLFNTLPVDHGGDLDDDGEQLDIGKDFTDWAVRNACTRTAFQEAIGILRRYLHRVPKYA